MTWKHAGNKFFQILKPSNTQGHGLVGGGNEVEGASDITREVGTLVKHALE